MKHIYNEFANLIYSYDVAFGTSGRWNLPLMVPVIGMGVWWHALAFVAHETAWHRAYVV